MMRCSSYHPLSQDFLAYLPFKKSHPSPSMHAALKDLKYVLTGISLVVAVLVGYRRAEDPTSTPAGVRASAFCCPTCRSLCLVFTCRSLISFLPSLLTLAVVF